MTGLLATLTLLLKTKINGEYSRRNGEKCERSRSAFWESEHTRDTAGPLGRPAPSCSHPHQRHFICCSSSLQTGRAGTASELLTGECASTRAEPGKQHSVFLKLRHRPQFNTHSANQGCRGGSTCPRLPEGRQEHVQPEGKVPSLFFLSSAPIPDRHSKARIQSWVSWEGQQRFSTREALN